MLPECYGADLIKGSSVYIKILSSQENLKKSGHNPNKHCTNFQILAILLELL